VVFLNADRTIYGRYGTRAAGRNEADTHISVSGFKKAMERALDTHKGYPANKKQLAGYTGLKAEFTTPEKIPTMRANDCIHCHQIHDSLVRHKWEQKELKDTDLFVYPMPERIGLKMDPEDCLIVKRVSDASPAAKAGLEIGDRIVSINGSPLHSQADIQWVLHRSPSNARLAVVYERGSRSVETTVALAGTWKLADLSWRESSWRALRHGVRFVALSPDRKKQRNIAPDAMAFEVKNMYGPGPEPLRRAGVKIGDVIIRVDDRTDLVTETQFLVYIRLKYAPGEKIPLSILRSGKRMDLDVPTW
jgi:serine protease Do